MDHARFLLHIEREGRPCTYNHYLNAEIQKKRQGRMTKIFNEADKHEQRFGVVAEKHEQNSVKLAGQQYKDVNSMIANRSNAQHTREDIHDVLESYYKVARKRFVDNICTQVISHFLLDGAESPLNILSPDLILHLSADQLDAIAGEDDETGRHRAFLKAEIVNLEAAAKVLRS